MPPVSSSQHSVYCAWPCWIRPRSLVSVALTNSAATGPATMILPRWLTSKMPTDSRTAVCSFTTPVGYSSGIDQPAKSANFAPSSTCRSWSGEVSGEVSGEADAVSSVPSMTGNLPRLSCVGEHLHTAQRQPREDPLRRGGPRRGAGRQGPRGGRRGRRGRLSVRAGLPPAAGVARCDGQGRRDHLGPDRQADRLAVAGDRG